MCALPTVSRVVAARHLHQPLNRVQSLIALEEAALQPSVTTKPFDNNSSSSSSTGQLTRGKQHSLLRGAWLYSSEQRTHHPFSCGAATQHTRHSIPTPGMHGGAGLLRAARACSISMGVGAGSSRWVSSRSAAQQLPCDKITIKGARFFGRHGVLPEEAVVGQPFVVDITLNCTSLKAAGTSDDLSATVSYADVFKIVQGIVEGPPAALIETVAHRSACAVLAAYPPSVVQSVTVSISKVFIPALSAAVSSVGVEVTRSHADL